MLDLVPFQLVAFLPLENVSWFPVDIAMRVDIDNSYDVDDVRKRLQVALNKEFDYRFWNWKNKVEWDNLLQIAKNTEGITYVADKYFYPNKDIVVPKNQLETKIHFLKQHQYYLYH